MTSLPPEACLDLQIQLDRLTRAAERCRASLRRVASGEMTGEEYARVFREQQDAQEELERQHEKHLPTAFGMLPRPSAARSIQPNDA